MKITKRVLAVILAALFVVAAFAGCSASGKDDSAKSEGKTVKLGLITLHDENSTYDKNFIVAAQEAAEKMGVELVQKNNIEEGQAAYDAAAELAALPDASLEEKEGGGMLLVLASNNSGEGREREWKNGGMGMDIIEVDGNTAYALLCNLGGEFEPGDLILFDMSFHGENAYLFEVPAPEQLQTELVVPLNESAYDGKTYRWDTATITPISFRLDGSGYGRNETTISLTLNDWTNFSLTNPGNDSTPYGTYGSLGHSGTGGGEEDREIKSSWLFARLVDLNELSSITVDGVTYSLQ